ncbi:MAG: ABC transporter permease [Anaerolineae bacterium UTCFX2]|jgi:ribose transport system permease protein|nr:ABC transporter permease [Anaerolineales bacterium]OQY90547.1 MAG: ABC transporter permease [Anaerolineae bacterium UTCFX2]
MKLSHLSLRHPYLLSAIIFFVVLVVNFYLQESILEGNTINNNMRVFLPLVLLTAGQAVVILTGGIDISVGSIVSIVSALLATRVGLEGTVNQTLTWFGIVLLVGILAGSINGFFVSYLRLQPIITTYATSFFFGGLALFILPQPGGGIPAKVANVYRTNYPLGLHWAFYVIPLLVLSWVAIRQTRYGRYLFAVGGRAQAAYETAVPVNQIIFSTYVVSGFMAALTGICITLLTGSGNPQIGDPMTLQAITAVVIGGTALSGGVGGIAGPILGALTLGIIKNIVSFANIDYWWQTFVNYMIILIALAAPGFIALFRRNRS